MALPLAALAAGGSVLSGLGGLFGSSAQEKAAKRALKFQKQVYGENVDRFQPSIDIGQNALRDLSYAYGQGDPEQVQGYIDQFQNSPNYLLNYQSGRDLGAQGIQGKYAAGGLLNSGAKLKALSRYGTDYNNNFLSQYQGGQRDLARTGQGAISSLAGVSQNYANNASNLMQDQGAAQAAGYQGFGNTFNNALGGYAQGNALQQYGPQGTSGFGQSEFGSGQPKVGWVY